MKILHVVSLIDPEGSFGGPLRVAVNQLRTLQEQGHDVTLAAGAQGYDGDLPTSVEGVRLRAFPAFSAAPQLGFAGLMSPRLIAWLVRHARDYDIVHVHLARDLVSLPAAQALRALGVPYVLQTHGMIDESSKSLARVLDAVSTRRVLRGAKTVFALTAAEAADLGLVEPRLRDVRVLPNGVPETSLCASPATSQDVLFLARIASRKRPADFVRAAQELAPRWPEATFSLVGPDEDALHEVLDLLSEDDADGRIKYEGALPPERTLERMTQAGIYVLPAHNEPFGMTVIEAMSVGLPAVVRNDCGLRDVVEDVGGAIFDSTADLASAIESLLADPQRRKESGQRGQRYVTQHGGMTAIGRDLAAAYATGAQS